MPIGPFIQYVIPGGDLPLKIPRFAEYRATTEFYLGDDGTLIKKGTIFYSEVKAYTYLLVEVEPGLVRQVNCVMTQGAIKAGLLEEVNNSGFYEPPEKPLSRIRFQRILDSED